MSDDRHDGWNLRDLVREVLMRHWDPIGVRDVPTAQGEYDFYVGPIAVMVLDEPVTRDKIAAYLFAMTTERIDLKRPGLEERCNEAADALLALRPKFRGSRAAVQLAWARKVAGLVVDALIMADLMPPWALDQAINIATEEINVRLALEDRPPS